MFHHLIIIEQLSQNLTRLLQQPVLFHRPTNANAQAITVISFFKSIFLNCYFWLARCFLDLMKRSFRSFRIPFCSINPRLFWLNVPLSTRTLISSYELRTTSSSKHHTFA